MNCSEFMRCVDDYLEGALDGDESQAASAHVRDCPACRRRLRLDQQLTATLRELPIPAPRAGFFEEAIARAQQSGGSAGRRRWWYGAGTALAASLALWLGLGWLPDALHSPSENSPGVTITLHEPRTLRLALNSERDLRRATLRIVLPEGVELQGFPGQRDIRWQTDLARGVNMLALPLVAVSAHGGSLVAHLEHDGRRTKYTVELQVDDATGARAG